MAGVKVLLNIPGKSIQEIPAIEWKDHPLDYAKYKTPLLLGSSNAAQHWMNPGEDCRNNTDDPGQNCSNY